MDQISEGLSMSFLNIFITDHLHNLEYDDNWELKIKNLKSDDDWNSKNSKEMIAQISLMVENFCYVEKPDMEKVLTFIIQISFVFSRAFESKIGDLQNVYLLLITNYNNNRAF